MAISVGQDSAEEERVEILRAVESPLPAPSSYPHWLKAAVHLWVVGARALTKGRLHKVTQLVGAELGLGFCPLDPLPHCQALLPTKEGGKEMNGSGD